MSEFVNSIFTSDYMQYIMLIMRIINPFVAFFVVWKCYNSFRKGLRRATPVILLRDVITQEIYKIIYWENSIGRSKSCDIVVENETVSRDHAVLLRRNTGWYICDTGSLAGVYVNGKKCEGRAIVEIGDKIKLGKKTLVLEETEIQSDSKRRFFNFFNRQPASPFLLVFLSNLVHLSMAIQLTLGTGEFNYEPMLLFIAVTMVGWIFCLVSTKGFKRKTFEIETIGFLLSGIGLHLLAGFGVSTVLTQFVAFVCGICVFCFMLSFMANADRVTKWRLTFAILAILLFSLNMAIGSTINGSKNWIYIGNFSIQPSELIKVAFVIVGASTLDKLQTKKNIGEFIVFAAVCLGFLFIMQDFGSACVFFAAFLIIAFMRSGSFRTIALILAVAILGVVMILYFKPYVANRFAGWGNVWSHINDSLGYQQTRTLTYIASGGLFGMGLGNGYLKYIAAAESDLVFGLLSEEQGLLMGLVVAFALVVLVLIVMSDVKRSRSSFYSIASCAAVGILMFQSCLNIFGSTDIFPLTGVTLPFISSGGSSMMTVWALIAFVKASDERTYAFKKMKKDEEVEILKKG